MFTRPENFSDDAVVTAVTAGWGLHAESVEYLPVGFGSFHWRLEADGRRWFVTADEVRTRKSTSAASGGASLRKLQAALSTARRLSDAGLSFVIAPVTTAAGDVLHLAADRFAVTVYPYVEGEAREYDSYQSRDERLAVLDRIVKVHQASGSTIRDALVDDYGVVNRDELTVALTDHPHRWDTGPYGEPARTLLAQYAGDVERQLAHYDALVEAVRPRSDRFVLTHGEPHPRNTLLSDVGVVLVDWDTALIGPPERDIWTLADGDAQILDRYASLTGVALLNDALALYRLRWDLTEIAIYIRLFREPHRATTDTSVAWKGLNDSLDPRRWQAV
ncbi:MAG: spectinomycin phosphotransferase [Actinomycetota bacterium]|nr:spectinomycin phosphotransferase [Actinomycetota bacterium]